ncbi:MAG: hypothetical protein EOO44_06920 [Flavobacterium sp.]|nr:MAG: hypothetical protein EOO44_06920 [Flavobacterium sp.]
MIYFTFNSFVDIIRCHKTKKHICKTSVTIYTINQKTFYSFSTVNFLLQLVNISR